MIRRLYAHNFRCFLNFELRFDDLSSALIIGKNGTGKTSLGLILEIFQKIARGSSRVSDILSSDSFFRGSNFNKTTFEIDVKIDGNLFKYSLVFELPENWTEIRVESEKLICNENIIFSRKLAQTQVTKSNGTIAEFGIDWHMIALPIVQSPLKNNPVDLFRNWFAQGLILRPVPSLINGGSDSPTRNVLSNCTNLGAWFQALMNEAPVGYNIISDNLKLYMPDFGVIKNPERGKDRRSLEMTFRSNEKIVELSFDELSDGQKCFLVAAMAIATNKTLGPIFIFWDEPDNFISPSEVGQVALALRQAVKDHGQLITTSHNPELIRHFSAENTYIFHRKDSLHPPQVNTVEQLQNDGQISEYFTEDLIRGDIWP